MSIITDAWNRITGKIEIPQMTIPHYEITYTSFALSEGVKGDTNKIINLYFYNSLGFLSKKTFPYSQSLLATLEKKNRIPGIDKTEEQERFPVHSRISPQEVQYLEDS